MNQELEKQFVKVTQQAAIASSKWLGYGDKNAADDAAVEAMRNEFNKMEINGTVIIGEGERDEAPMLYIGEKVGKGTGIEIDIAVDPLECTNNVAYYWPNSISVFAASPRGTMLNAPDTYMDKIAVGPKAKGKIDLDKTVEENLHSVAEALNKPIEEVILVVLQRERHNELIKQARKTRCRIKLITDGDISGALYPSLPDAQADILMGTGAAPEGVISAAGLKALGGEIQGRLNFRNNEEKERAKKMGIDDLEKKLSIDDLVKGNDAIFAATGVSGGPMLKGVEFSNTKTKVYSMLISARKGLEYFNEEI